MIFRRLKKPDKKKEQDLKNEIELNGGLEKGDMFAMIVSALLVIVPVCLAVLLGLYFLTALIFGI